MAEITRIFTANTRDNFSFLSSKVCSITFEPPDIDLCSACHVYPLFRGAWIMSILFILDILSWGLDFII